MTATRALTPVRSILISAFAASLLSGVCGGQQSSPVTVPAEVVSGLVYMRGEVNHSGPLSVILDSGSSISVVSPLVADRLGLTSTGSVEAAGIAKGSNDTARLFSDGEFQCGDHGQVRVSHQQGVVLPIDYISAQVGKPVDAIFGSNLFLHYIISVDYANQRVTFAPPGTSILATGSPISLQLIGNDVYVEAALVGQDGKRISGLFLLDSGTAGSMILNRKFLEAHPGLIRPSGFVDSPTANAVGGAIHSKRVRLPVLDLGPFAFSNVVANVPNSSVGVLSDVRVAGFIGAEILARFTVTWDYSGSRMFLLPNKRLTESFDTDASGLHLTSVAPTYNAVIVDDVVPNSPGSQAGIKIGDTIVAVNGIKDLRVWKVSHMLRNAGSKIELTVRREDTVREMVLSLRTPFS
jgi:hypothetical protein